MSVRLFYGSTLIEKFIKKLMRHGSYNKIRTILQQLVFIGRQPNKIFIYNFFEMLELLRPFIKIKTLKRGRNITNLPTILTRAQQYNTAITWFCRAIQNKKQDALNKRILNELKSVLTKQSAAYEVKETLKNKIIENRASLRLHKKTPSLKDKDTAWLIIPKRK